MPTKNTIICDIDGVLADCGHRLGFIKPLVLREECRDEAFGETFFRCRSCLQEIGTAHHERCDVASGRKDWDSFHDPKHVALDMACVQMCAMIRLVFGAWPGEFVFLTGRPERLKPTTLTWLRMNVHQKIRNSQLWMRCDGDHRTDVDIKREYGERLGFARIAAVFEDRDRVVKMWRENKVLCLQPCAGAY